MKTNIVGSINIPQDVESTKISDLAYLVRTINESSYTLREDQTDFYKRQVDSMVESGLSRKDAAQWAMFNYERGLSQSLSCEK